MLGAVILRYEGWSALGAAAVLATLGGVLAIRAAEAADDPGWVVIDEVAGQWIALLGLRHVSLGGLVALSYCSGCSISRNPARSAGRTVSTMRSA